MCILTPPFYQQKINVPSNFRAGSVNVGVNEVKSCSVWCWRWMHQHVWERLWPSLARRVWQTCVRGTAEWSQAKLHLMDAPWGLPDTHTLSHTHMREHTGLLTVTFDVKVEASDIYAGGFIKVGPWRSSRGKDHREGIQLKHDRAQGSGLWARR